MEAKVLYLKLNMDQKTIKTTVKLPVMSESPKDMQPKQAASFFDGLTHAKQAVVFSPHLDDLVLSAGSFVNYLADKHVPVSAITIFTQGSNITSSAIQTLLGNAGFPDAQTYFKARRIEDEVALKCLGSNISSMHLGYTDAAWRAHHGAALYPDTQLANISALDAQLHAELVGVVKKLITHYEESIIFAPLGRGRHVDHQITRNVVAEAFPNVIFYEDFPYSSLYASEDEYIETHRLKGFEWQGDYQAKEKAILAYKTQRVSLFGRGPMQLPFEKYYRANF